MPDQADEYDIGDTVLLKVTITNTAGSAADPSGEITFKHQPTPGAASSTEIYNGGAGNVTKTATGKYQFATAAKTESGRHRFSVTTEGDLIGYEESSFYVRPKLFTT